MPQLQSFFRMNPFANPPAETCRSSKPRVRSISRKVVATILTAVCLIALPTWPMLSSTHAASILRVPLDFGAIQSAIDAAIGGDTVLVSAGTYFENINFRGKAITVKSESGPEVTIIDGSNRNSVVTFRSLETRASVLLGFTLRNGHASGNLDANFEGGGIEISASSPSIIANVITEIELQMGVEASGSILPHR